MRNPVQDVKEKEEEQMSKDKNERSSQLHIKWVMNNDGLRPTPAPWGYVLRNPVSVAIPPGATMKINLDVAADFPMMAWPQRSHQDDLTVPMIIQAGQDVVVMVENKSKHSILQIEDGESLVNLHPLLHPGSTTEVG